MGHFYRIKTIWVPLNGHPKSWVLESNVRKQVWAIPQKKSKVVVPMVELQVGIVTKVQHTPIFAVAQWLALQSCSANRKVSGSSLTVSTDDMLYWGERR